MFCWAARDRLTNWRMVFGKTNHHNYEFEIRKMRRPLIRALIENLKAEPRVEWDREKRRCYPRVFENFPPPRPAVRKMEARNAKA